MVDIKRCPVQLDEDTMEVLEATKKEYGHGSRCKTIQFLLSQLKLPRELIEDDIELIEKHLKKQFDLNTATTLMNFVSIILLNSIDNEEDLSYIIETSHELYDNLPSRNDPKLKKLLKLVCPYVTGNKISMDNLTLFNAYHDSGIGIDERPKYLEKLRIVNWTEYKKLKGDDINET